MSGPAAPAAKPVQYSRPFIGLNLGVNIALSISIVLLNKIVYSRYGFPNITMTFLHFVCTSIGMFVCRCLGVFTAVPLPLSKMLPVSLTFCGFVVFTNLSLQNNTVGTYQIMKTLTTPCIMVLQAAAYQRSFSAKVKLSVVPIMLGVFLNCAFDIKFNLLGMAFALAGVAVTSLYQVWVSEKQKELQVNAMQLLYYQAPLSACVLLFVIPVFEPIFAPGGILNGSWTIEPLMLVSATGVVAFAINLSIFWIIGNTSPLTYNMVGHFKFCLTVLGGWVLFRDPLEHLQLLGIVVTFSGIMAYTHFKMAEQKKDQQQEQQKAQKDVEALQSAKETLLNIGKA